MAEFVDAVPVEEVGDESATVVEVSGIQVAIVKTGGRFYALQNRCTHADHSIGEGDVVEERVIECPGHGATFDAATGSALTGPAEDSLQTYAVEIVSGIVRIAVE